MICPKCKHKTEDPDAVFCENCGAKLEEEASPSPRSPVVSGSDREPSEAGTHDASPRHTQSFEADDIVATGGSHVGHTVSSGESAGEKGGEADRSSFKTGDVVATGGSHVGNKIEIREQKIIQGPQELEKDKVFECPLCGFTGALIDTFACKRCGERRCKANCYDAKYNCCKQCATQIAQREAMCNDLCRAQLFFGDDRKVFVIAKEQIGFGKAKRGRRPEVDIILRLMPARSAKLDPQNWTNSLKISDCHGFFAYRNGAMYIQDRSTNGIFEVLGGLESGLPGGSMSDIGGTVQEEERNSLAGVDRISLKPFKPDAWSPLPHVCTLSLGKTGLIQLRTRVFRDASQVAALKIERLSNWPQHMYVQLISKAVIGNSENSCINISDPAIVGEVAALTWENVSFCLSRIGNAAEVLVDKRPLAADEKITLADNSRITIGQREFVFTTASDNDFVKVE